MSDQVTKPERMSTDKGKKTMKAMVHMKPIALAKAAVKLVKTTFRTGSVERSGLSVEFYSA